MQAELVNGDLVFTFGPHGSLFHPPVELRLDWSKFKDLGTPDLYYIQDDGDYALQKPDHVDTQGKFVILYLDHFSRYAFGWGPD